MSIFVRTSFRRTLLVALAASLTLTAALTFLPTELAAVPCCELCFPNYDACIDGCGGNRKCEKDCENTLGNCFSKCLYCWTPP